MPRTSQQSAGSTTTRAPDFQFAGTPEPVSTIVPTISCPSTNGVETNGEKYGLPLQPIAERSEPQMPLKRGLMRTQSGAGSGGGGRSASVMHDNAPLAADDQRDESARTNNQRGTERKNWMACGMENVF